MVAEGDEDCKQTLLKIALGSTSKLKIEAVRLAFAHFERPVEIVTVKAKSGIPDQPEGFDVMLYGAQERARAALVTTSGALLGIGLESGTVSIFSDVTQKGKYPSLVRLYFDPAIAVIIDRHGNEYAGFGPGFPIPKWAVEEALGSELGKVVMKRGAKGKNPMAYFSNGKIDRTEILSSAVKMALAEYFNPKRYT